MVTVEVISSMQQYRRWTAEQKKAMVLEAEQPEMRISTVARKYEVHPNQLFRWRRLFHEGAAGRPGRGGAGALVVSTGIQNSPFYPNRGPYGQYHHNIK